MNEVRPTSGWARPPRSRGDLTGLQQEVLVEAFESVSLAELLNWCTPSIDGPYWNRKWRYVPELSAAAVALLDFGLIEVLRGQRVLSLQDARAVLLDPSNWWSFDRSDRSDEDEWSKLVDAGATTRTDDVDYRLAGTDRGKLPWPQSEQRTFSL